MAITKFKSLFYRLWMKTKHKSRTRAMRKRVRVLSGIKEEVANPHTELDARLLEMYKDRNLQPHDPAGQSPIVNLLLKIG